MTQSDPKHARIKAWLHWKRLELKDHPNEDIQLFVDEIESLLNENQRLREALERERNQHRMLPLDAELELDRRLKDAHPWLRRQSKIR